MQPNFYAQWRNIFIRELIEAIIIWGESSNVAIKERNVQAGIDNVISYQYEKRLEGFMQTEVHISKHDEV